MPTFLLTIIDWFRDWFDPLVKAPEPLVTITKAMPLAGARLRLTFSNGDAGVIDLARHVEFIGTLAPLRDPTIFRQAFVAHGTVCWPGDIDMDPTVLHHLTMGLPIDLVQEPASPVGA